MWAIGDVTGIWPLTYVSKYHGRVVASNILGRPREADYSAVPRVVFTDPQAASVGEAEGALTATVALAEVPRTSTYTRAYDTKPGFMTLVSDGERLTGAYALGPEAGEWLQQATVAIRARIPLEVMNDVIQPFPTFSEAFLHRADRAQREGAGGGVASTWRTSAPSLGWGLAVGGSLVVGAVAAALVTLPGAGSRIADRLRRRNPLLGGRARARPGGRRRGRAARSRRWGCSPARSCMSAPTGG